MHIDPPLSSVDLSGTPGDLHVAQVAALLPGHGEVLSLAGELGRGRGPFGPRSAPMRLLLVPSAAYAEADEGLRRSLAQLLDIDLYTAGAHLRRAWPSFLSAPEHVEEGERLAESLRGAGFRILVVEGAAWATDHLPIPISTLERGGGAGCWRFVDEDGHGHDVTSDDFRWAAVGEITEDLPERPTSQDRNRWGLAQRPPTGALERSAGSYVLLDLFRSSSSRALRIRTDQFDFNCLGESRSLSSAVNLKSLLERLSPSAGPVLRVDNAFRRVPHLPPRPTLVAQAGARARALSREAEFTEYVLLLDRAHRGEH